MKQIVLLFSAILIAGLTQAQFEKDYKRTHAFTSVYNQNMIRSVDSFDKSLIMTEEYNNKTRAEVPAVFIETFDEAVDANPWSVSMTHDTNLGDLDWKVGNDPGNPYDWSLNGEPTSPMLYYFNDQTVANFSNSGGKFAFYDAIAFSYKPGLTELRSKGYLTIGPFDFSDIQNPVIRWTQLYRKFNHDSTFIEYSTNNADFNSIRVNKIESGFGQVQNNLAFLPASELGGADQVYIRFTWAQTEEVDNSLFYGGGYGWQVDDISIIDNVDFELQIGKIATEFFVRVETQFHNSSTYINIPQEEFKSGARLYFACPVTNNGNMPISPKLDVAISDPSGEEIYTRSVVWNSNPILSGVSDTLYIPVEEGFFLASESDPDPDIKIGEYKINYSVSIPGEQEFNQADNEDSTVFIITNNGLFSRDHDKTTSNLAPSTWSSGGSNNDEIGTKYLFHEDVTINSVDVFISHLSHPDNAFSIVLYRGTSDGEEIIAESPEVTLTQEMLGKWNNISFNNPQQIIAEEGYVTSIYVMVKMQYNNSNPDNKHIFIAGDPSTKASSLGVLWRFIGSINQGIFYISNAAKVGLCLRVNCDVASEISENLLDNFEIELFPNPTKDFINFESSEEIKSIEILSLMGSCISKQDINANAFTYQTSELSNGNYLVRIYTNNTVVVKQFSVVK